MATRLTRLVDPAAQRHAALQSPAQQLLKGIWKDGHVYIKAGVVLGELGRSSRWQSSFFDEPLRDNSRLMAAIDTINREVGRVHLAASGLKPHGLCGGSTFPRPIPPDGRICPRCSDSTSTSRPFAW